ncbi:MAG: helix-turn-helix transcriptional regulator [Eubacteriales bacterium]|nr:helix-turn-helix transcriptional regulator [Eubacteriales bacterium]MDD3882426.1 helix-turn-helix transcriptional regulator [Eubacteriales bacterium]MDD4513806.1 helix-turn-helix transcriptional regulator [Eubacteriales bacterium]
MLIRLRELRKEYGISQLQLAIKLGISQQSINKYENHNIEPDIFLLSQMADYFATSVDYIIGRTDVREPCESLLGRLDSKASQFIRLYNSLSDEQRECLSNTASIFSKSRK